MSDNPERAERPVSASSYARTVFLSASHDDDPFVERLRADLAGRGISVSSAPQGLALGSDEWHAAVRGALREALALVLVASPHARASRYVADELRLAGMYQRPVVAVWAEGDEWAESIPQGWGNVPFVDARGGRYETGLRELLAALPVAPSTEAPAAEGATAAGAAPREDPDSPDTQEDARPPKAWPTAPTDRTPPGAVAPPPPPLSSLPPAPIPQAPAPSAQRDSPSFAPRDAGSWQRQEQGGTPAQVPARVEEVTFTAYHPREVALRAWEPLVLYISLDTPQALARVAAAAEERLAGRRERFRPASAPEPAGLSRGAALTLVPALPGFRCNPPELTVSWEEDVQQHEFRLRAETAPAGQAVNGRVRVFTGPLLRAEVPISIFVQPTGARADGPEGFASVVARAYRRVFASYSHWDTPVVRSCETAAQTTGDRYLRDVTLLRGGERWDPRLLQAIAEADLFQLFWSEHAAKSPAVEREWRQALALEPARGTFIRPVYWSRQPYAIPPELGAIHFERLELARLGWGRARQLLYRTLGRG